MALLDGRMSGRMLGRAYNTPTTGTSAMLGDAQFQQLLAAYNNRQPVRSMTSTGEGQFDHYTPDSASLNGYQIEAFGPNKDMYRVYQNLPDGADQVDYNDKPFDLYSNNGQYIGTHQFANMGGGPVLDALDGFWDKAIPIVTTLFVGGGIAGAAGYGPMAAGEGAAAGSASGAGAAGGAVEGAGALTTGGGGFGSAGQVFGGNLGGAGYGFSGVGSSLGGASGLGGSFGSSLIPAGMGYNIPGLGSSLLNAGAAAGSSGLPAGGLPSGGGGAAPSTPASTGSTPFNMGDLLKSPNLLGQLANLGGTLYSASQAGKAADAQAQAAREAQAMFKPWTDAGGWSIGQAANMLGKNGATAAQNAFMQSPDYQFRRSEGEKALTRAAAASGLRGSGKFLKDYNRFNQDLASTEFGNSLNRLLAVAGMGQTATGSSADYGTQAANAVAAGSVGKANAISGGITQGLSMYNNQQQQNQNNALLRAILGG